MDLKVHDDSHHHTQDIYATVHDSSFHVGDISLSAIGSKKSAQHVYAAKTCLLLPFPWSTPSINSNNISYANDLRSRQIMDEKGTLHPLWIEDTHIPHSANELNPLIRETFGFPAEKMPGYRGKNKTKGPVNLDFGATEDGGIDLSSASASKSNVALISKKSSASGLTSAQNMKTLHRQEVDKSGGPSLADNIQLQDRKVLHFLPVNEALRNPFEEKFKKDAEENETAKRIQLSPEALACLFSNPCLVAQTANSKESDYVTFPMRVERVSLIILPIGTCIMEVHINWVTSDAHDLTLDDIRTRVFLAKFRQRVSNYRFGGWLLNHKYVEGAGTEELFKKMNKYYGYHVLKALLLNKPTSISHIANFLVQLSKDNLDVPIPRFPKHVTKSYHHSLIVADSELDDDLLYDYLAHLSKGDGLEVTATQSNTKRREIKQDGLKYYKKRHGISVHFNRHNRYIAQCREGTIALSWASKGRNDPEVTMWPHHFFGVFLMLATYVLGEDSILNEFSNLQTITSYQLKRTMILTSDNVINADQLRELDETRKSLSAISMLFTRFGLQMGSETCGGLSEHVNFFNTLRKIFRVRDQRKEAREEIQDVLKLVEQSYLEEERKFKIKRDSKLEKREHLKQIESRKKEKANSRFDFFIALIASLTIPGTLIFGAMGMNMSDVPVQWKFRDVCGITAAISIALVVFFTICKLALSWFAKFDTTNEEESELRREIEEDMEDGL